MARRSMADGPTWIVKHGHRVYQGCTEPIEADGRLTFTCGSVERTVPVEGTTVTECPPHGVFEHVTRA